MMRLSRITIDHNRIAGHSPKRITKCVMRITHHHGWASPCWFAEPCGCVHILPTVVAAERLRMKLWSAKISETDALFGKWIVNPERPN